jgi:hypothetical protein
MLYLSLTICITAFFILSASLPCTVILAADDAEAAAIGDVTDPGILPDSGFYFIKSWGRNLQLMFAGSDTQRARLMLKYTNEDALALKKMYDMGKYDVGTKHAEQYALQLRDTVQTMEQVMTKQRENASEDLISKLEQNYLQQQEVLLSVLEKTPVTAQQGLLNAIENSNKHVAAMVMAQQGQIALQQYQEQVNQQIKNMGQETKIRVQQKLHVTHGQAGQPSNANFGQGITTQTEMQTQIQMQTQTQIQTQTQMQSQFQTQTSTQTMQQAGQQNRQTTQNQGTGQSNANSGNHDQGFGNQNQRK